MLTPKWRPNCCRFQPPIVTKKPKESSSRVTRRSKSIVEPFGLSTRRRQLKLQESSEEEDTPSPEEHLTAEVKDKREGAASAATANLKAARARFEEARKAKSTPTSGTPRSAKPAQLEATLKVGTGSTRVGLELITQPLVPPLNYSPPNRSPLVTPQNFSLRI